MRYLTSNNAALVPLILIFLASLLLIPWTAGAGTLPNWTIDETWSVRAIHLQPDGRWSDPVNWRFQVIQEDDDEIHLVVHGGGDSRANLVFEKQTGQLCRVGLTDLLRGEEISREIRIEDKTPVYPMFSVIPYFFPVRGHETGTSVYLLQRHLNGRKLPPENLTQSVKGFSSQELEAALPDAARTDTGSLDAVSADRLFIVEKDGALVFLQFWDSESSWALYTESPGCKAWLVRDVP